MLPGSSDSVPAAPTVLAVRLMNSLRPLDMKSSVRVGEIEAYVPIVTQRYMTYYK